MGTKYNTLFKQIRTLVDDIDQRKIVYADHVLDSHIRNIILSQSVPVLAEDDESPASFTAELTMSQKGYVIFSVAEAIIVGMPEDMSYKHPTLAVRKKQNIAQRLSYIRDSLGKIEIALTGRSRTALGSSVIEAILGGPDAYQQEIS